MKKVNSWPAFIAGLMLMAVSCTKDDPSVLEEEMGETALLSFRTVLNDLISSKAALKQELSLPECSDDAPATVEVILSRGGLNVVGDIGSPVSIPINPTPYDYDSDGEDEYFTDESSDLELEPGDYVLEYFQVLDGDGDVLWAAPIDTGAPGDFSGLVDFPLPMDISLGAGVKKYVPVEVVCYDDRFVNEYGYLFFDIENSEAIEFCLFGNVCDENGRHAPANFRFDVWMYSGDPANPWGTALFDANDPYVNTLGVNNDGDAYADPLCLFLPDTDGEDVYYGELYLIENGTSTLIREGQFTDADVTGLFDGEENTDYYHFREGCGGDDGPNLFGEPGNPGECDSNNPIADCDGDGVLNDTDECPGTPAGTEVNELGCESIQVPGSDLVVFNDANMFDDTSMLDPDNVRFVQNLVNYTTIGSRNSGNVVWLDRGRSARCYQNGECNEEGWSIMESVIASEGFTVTPVFSSSGSLTSIPAEVKVIFLVMPTVDYSIAEINALKAFAAEGGRIIFVGEWSGFYLNIDVQNQFLINMGAVLHNTGGAVDCEYTEIPSSSNRSHPIMTGIDELTIGCASVIEPGPNDFALFYDTTNSQVLAGVAKIDTSPVVSLRPLNQKRAIKPIENVLYTSSGTGY
ncbi:hypothetical protein [Salinimicrobium sp. GXAS 041]|uniref:hypothetical protein n=1 Tax=Salinimicrobium sp. GXAS 041 TaxID=3400806 RepID=UPI003C7763AA